LLYYIISKVRFSSIMRDIVAVVAATAETRGIGYQGQLVRLFKQRHLYGLSLLISHAFD
jgi:hypothetical protein